MKNRFWAVGCGLGWAVGKKVWADYEQPLREVFSCFHGQNKSKLKKISVRTKKLHKMKLNFFFP